MRLRHVEAVQIGPDLAEQITQYSQIIGGRVTWWLERRRFRLSDGHTEARTIHTAGSSRTPVPERQSLAESNRHLALTRAAVWARTLTPHEGAEPEFAPRCIPPRAYNLWATP